jgi:hypothetical protein
VPNCGKCSNNEIPGWNWIRFRAMAGSVPWWTCEQSAPAGGSFREPGGRFLLIRTHFAVARFWPARSGAAVRTFRRHSWPVVAASGIAPASQLAYR